MQRKLFIACCENKFRRSGEIFGEKWIFPLLFQDLPFRESSQITWRSQNTQLSMETSRKLFTFKMQSSFKLHSFIQVFCLKIDLMDESDGGWVEIRYAFVGEMREWGKIGIRTCLIKTLRCKHLKENIEGSLRRELKGKYWNCERCWRRWWSYLRKEEN